MKPALTAPPASPRLDYLDAVRAVALLLGIVFHASLSFLPFFIDWAVMDVSTSPMVASFMAVSHSFRMELFFLIAGFFGHLTFHAKGARAFLRSRFLRLVVPFVIGWFLLRPLIVSGWIMGSASMRGDVDIGAGLRGGFQSLAALPAGIFTGTHLWFLYYLTMVTAVVLVLRAIVTSIGPWWTRMLPRLDAMFVWLGASRISLLIFAVPTAGVLWFMQIWGVDTPDQTLLPHVPVLLLYGGFFACGWMLQRNVAVVAPVVRLTITRAVVAGISIAGVLLLIGFQRDPGHPHYTLARLGFAASYAVMMWSLVFFTMGVFQRLCRRSNAVVRYVADSSYWLYLIHLPIVVWLQVAVAELPLHWSIKLVGISAGTILMGLLTYDLFVRSTWMGQVLNGRRRNRCLFGTPSGGPVAGSVATASHP